MNSGASKGTSRDETVTKIEPIALAVIA